MKTKRHYNRLKVILAEHDISSKALADALQIKRLATVSDWCTNSTQPSLETLNGIADYLDIDVRDLLVSNKTPSGQASKK